MTGTSVKVCLSTDYRRTCYFKQNFSLIEPVEYLYRQGSTNTFAYVPLPLLLETLLRCPDFLGALVFRQKHLAGVYRSFDEGVEISLALYIDEFEIANPLGTSRNIHKIVGVNCVILNLPVTFRAGLTSIQLGALGNSHDVKEFGYERFLEPLIKDLKLIEDNGIDVDALKRSVGVKLFCVCADNLGSKKVSLSTNFVVSV